MPRFSITFRVIYLENEGVLEGQNSISGDILKLETQKFAFRLILGWGIQIWNQISDILKT